MCFSVEPGLRSPEGIDATCQSEPSCAWEAAQLTLIDNETEVRPIQQKLGQGVPGAGQLPVAVDRPSGSGRFGLGKPCSSGQA